MAMLLGQWRVGAPPPLKDSFPGFKLRGDGAAQARQACMDRPFMMKRPDETVGVTFLGDGHKPHGNDTRVVSSYETRHAMPHT